MIRKNKEKGFTIIEVVLVLAIAGLIFLVVFLALPALQRNQRDTQRKNDIGRVITEVNNFQSNSKGTIPSDTTMSTFVDKYLKANGQRFFDPATKNDYDVKIGTVGSTPTKGQILIVPGAECDGTTTKAATENTRQYAVIGFMEGSGGVYCQDV